MTTDEVQVWRFTLDRTAAEVARLRRLLEPDELQRSDRYHFPRDRDRFVVARARLRLLLGRYLSAEASTLRFSYGPMGKPELAATSHEPAPQFSVSHSDGLSVIAVGGLRKVGVDIERIRPLASPHSLIGVLAPGEDAALRALPDSLRQQAFFACWTRKEAYIKARGDGLSFGLDRFEVSVEPDSPAALLRVEDDPTEVSRWVLQQLNAAPGYSGALAVEGSDWRLRCWDWEE